ncbi:MAG: UDP-N-acetylmuramoyl-tripeptide--D-alanyl-D-alanine ligase [Kiritimatiellia bacterium]|nr:UDP-N-acetylmuramoyl-tripeptide--D-alanyl-D-alanine ligase [Kiritimatiellia bacterium]
MAKFDPSQLAEWSGGSWHNGIPRVIDGVSADSRRIARGNIFIAIRGPRFDGHDFVSSAFQQGASGAVVARPDLAGKGFGPLLVVNDTSQALRQIAAGYRRTLDIKVIAVTGSVGKTTVKEMIAAILTRRLATAKTIGNWNNEYGLPLSILSMESSAKAGVFELGVNHKGELLPLCQLLKPDWGVVTAIGPVHLEYFGSEKAVAEEKAVLLKNLPENGIAFLGCDHSWYDLLRSAAGCRVISVGEREDADYVLLKGGNEGGEQWVFEKESGEKFNFRPPLPGRHIAYDALFAIAAARANGFNWRIIREGLENYKPQPMRWESETIGGVLTINDAYNANPMSMEAALRTFETMQHSGHKWLVFAGMHELGAVSEEEHKKLGLAIARFKWAGLITVGLLGNMIADAAEKAGMERKNIFRCGNHSSAAEILAASVKPGDAVLLKASRCERLEKVLEIWRQIQKDRNSSRS